MEYTEDADAQLSRLERDPARVELLRRVYAVIDHIDEAPGDASVRPQRLDDTAWGPGPVWAVQVRGEDWVVIWRADGGIQTIAYSGPIPGS